ncbi:MAG: MBL fold metallo-hydrolase [Clostridia bacterium]|nr:MBL fold metallo-hydrolase [Clostridia bacterium]
MKRTIWILLTVLLVAALAATFAACDLVDKVLQKAEQIVEDMEKEAEKAEQEENGGQTDASDPTDGTGTNAQNGGQSGRTEDKTDVEAKTGDVVLEEGDLSFHFLTLGNNRTGDSTYIKIGDVDILIDAGSRQNSAATIIEYVNRYCTDGKLEYVIATHAHQDHLTGFYGLKGKDGNYAGVLHAFDVGTIIEFARTNATSGVYTNYCAARDYAVTKGAKAYTALECWNNQKGAQRSYTLAEGVTMDVLYQDYYEKDSSDENNYSVCVMFNYGDSHYLFTGDLEKEGESSLVEKNELPHCKLFKGGHHGSYTANTAKLMQAIQPDVVCVCCCCGSKEYTSVNENTFPSQAFFDRVLPYTDRIFATTLTEFVPSEDDDDEFDEVAKDMNGNIVVVTDGATLSVNCSGNATPVPYTEWFASNRTWPEGARALYDKPVEGQNEQSPPAEGEQQPAEGDGQEPQAGGGGEA